MFTYNFQIFIMIVISSPSLPKMLYDTVEMNNTLILIKILYIQFNLIFNYS